MLKRFVALAMVLVMVLGLGLVAYALPRTPCGHTEFTTKHKLNYMTRTSVNHTYTDDWTTICDICGSQLQGRDVVTEDHRYKQYSTHVGEKHVFTESCGDCGYCNRTATLPCTGSPHITCPW